jgi:hypothetical protein
MNIKSQTKFKSNEQIIDFMTKTLNKLIKDKYGSEFYLKLDSLTYNELINFNLFKVQKAYVALGGPMTNKEIYKMRDFIKKKYNMLLLSMGLDSDNLIRKIELIVH